VTSNSLIGRIGLREFKMADQGGTGPAGVVQKHPLGTFFVLCFALSWAIESPLVLSQGAVPAGVGLLLVVLASNVPSVLAIVLTAILSGRSGVSALLRRLVKGRVGLRWYLVVLAPAVIAVIAAALNVWVGGPALLLDLSVVAVLITLAFSIFPGSAVGEELGWRGFALPRMQVRRSALVSSLIIGVLWALWHLPLWLTGDPVRTPGLYLAFVASVLALSVILTWVYNSTRSLLVVVLLHATANLPVSLTIDALGADAVLPVLLYFGLIVVSAIVVVLVTGPENLSRTHRRAMELEPAVPV
jgi:uncharacterized protein